MHRRHRVVLVIVLIIGKRLVEFSLRSRRGGLVSTELTAAELLRLVPPRKQHAVSKLKI